MSGSKLQWSNFGHVRTELVDNCYVMRHVLCTNENIIIVLKTCTTYKYPNSQPYKISNTIKSHGRIEKLECSLLIGLRVES